MTIIFAAQTANADSTVVAWDGGILQLAIDGVFDGASIALHVDQDGMGYQNLVGLEQTVPDVNRVLLKKCNFKLVLTGAGASTSITASAI